jgi:hypothetical protein
VDEPKLVALRSLARAGRTEQRLATRARIVLRAAVGQPNNRIAAELHVAPMTVLLWRRRFERDRLAGLQDAPDQDESAASDGRARSRHRPDALRAPAGLTNRSSMLPLRPGQVERHTDDYKRHGTARLFAALEVATGTVTNEARERHTGADFLSFLHLLARTYPTGEVHVISTTSAPT